MEPKTENVFGRNLRAFRTFEEITQQELGDAVGVSNSAVNLWEKRGVQPRKRIIDDIIEHYGLTHDDLLSDTHGMYAKLYGLAEDALPIAASPSRSVPVRVLGATYAGSPDDPPLFDGEALLYEHLALEHPDCFALEVIGSCMDRVFTEADHIFVDPHMEPVDGSIAVVLIDGRTEARRFRRGNDLVMLVSESHDPQPDIVLRGGEDVVCQGVVFWWQAKHGTP